MRASEFITEKSKQWLRSQEKGLDMDDAKRLNRAVNMGFNISTIYYHGTSSDIESFDRLVNWFAESSAHASEYAFSRDYASGGGGSVVPCYLKYGHSFNADVLSKTTTIQQFVSAMARQTARPYENATVLEMMKKLLSYAREEESGPHYASYQFWFQPEMVFGHRGVDIIKNFFILFGFESILFTEDGVKTVGIINQANIRSIFAAFDKDFASTSDILS
jgi:hypothetical protein